MHKTFGSGTPWEDEVGYSRVVRNGERVFVSGTTGTGPDGRITAPGDMYAQTKRAIENIATALERAGARLADVVRTRIFVTDIARWKDVGRAHAEAFHSIKPACTLVQVVALVEPEMLVEIEADAIAASA